MRPISRYTLGIMAVVHGSAALMVAARLQGQGAPAAQGAGLTACSIIDAAELKRLTGLKDLLGRGPVLSDPSETPKGVSECEFLGLSFSLTTPITPEGFDATRKSQVKGGTKIEALSGVGDEAYYWWDPKPGSYKQVGIAFRAGGRRLVIMDLTSSDSIEAAKPNLLKAARMTAPKLR